MDEKEEADPPRGVVRAAPQEAGLTRRLGNQVYGYAGNTGDRRGHRPRRRARIRKILEEHDFCVVRLADFASIQFSKRGQDISLAFTWKGELAPSLAPGGDFWPWPDDAFSNRRHTLHGIACRAMSLQCLLGEKETYERYSGRPLREKDLVSIRMLRSLLS